MLENNLSAVEKEKSEEEEEDILNKWISWVIYVMIFCIIARSIFISLIESHEMQKKKIEIKSCVRSERRKENNETVCTEYCFPCFACFVY